MKLQENPTELNPLFLLVYEVIDLDSKPVKVSLDFQEEYLPFYCNLLTGSDFFNRTPCPGTGPENPYKKLTYKY